MNQPLFTQVVFILCIIILLIFIVLVVYIVKFLKVFGQFKLRIQQIGSLQRENQRKISAIKQKVVEVETTPLLGKKAKRVIQYKNAATSIVSFRKQQKLKKIEKEIKKSKARKVQRKVCKKYGK